MASLRFVSREEKAVSGNVILILDVYTDLMPWPVST